MIDNDTAAKPLFYVNGNRVFQRPVAGKSGTRMGFSICTVHPGVDPEEVCAILNKGEKPDGLS